MVHQANIKKRILRFLVVLLVLIFNSWRDSEKSLVASSCERSMCISHICLHCCI